MKKFLAKLIGIGWCGTPYIQMEKATIDEIHKEVIDDIPYLSKISSAYIQRRYKVSYDIASEVINLLEDKRIIGPADGAKPRDIIK